MARLRVSWRIALFWLMVIGALLGTMLRRSLFAPYGLEDLLYACAFAALAGLLVIPYRLWVKHHIAESTALLAKITKDTLLIYPQPGIEERVPLLGVEELSITAIEAGKVQIAAKRNVPIGTEHSLALEQAHAEAVVEFANAVLRETPVHKR